MQLTQYQADLADRERAVAADMLPRIVISLDFELRWGVHDVFGLDFDGYRSNLEQVGHIVPALLECFGRHGVAATWATVGAIACTDWDEYFARAPSPPAYRSARFRIKPEYAAADPAGALHFAPALISQIASCPGQELGSHTFSHLYLREAGITAGDVAADLAAVENLFRERYGVTPRSLVFPRNQPGFIDVVRQSSIKIWRGNPTPWYYACEDSERNGLLPRALKLLDGINPLTRRAAAMVGEMTRASLFLRLNLPRHLWRVHLAKIRREMAGLRPGEVFHLWFHPHNLGQDTDLRLGRVQQIAELIARKAQRGELVSCTMGDLIPS